MPSAPLRLTLLCPLICLGAGSAMAQRAVSVSPGSAESAARIAQSCPTFSWGAVEGASRYDLVVYELDDERGVARPGAPVFHVGLPGAALSWSPSLDRCLQPGRRYAWYVRAGDGRGKGEWSEARHFEVWSAPAPSPEDVARALNVLRSFLARDPAAAAELAIGTAAVSSENAGAGGEGAGAERTSRSIPPKTRPLTLSEGASAIRGEAAATTGASFGVVGVSHSAEGAALAAENTADGADLILAGATPTTLTETALNRPSSGAESFDIRNSGGGTMTLTVGGVEVVTSSTDRDSLGALACASGEVAKWSGSAWLCSADANAGGDITGVTAGSGLAGGGVAGAVTLAADTSVLQARISGTCPPGQSIRIIDDTGAVTCEPDDIGIPQAHGWSGSIQSIAAESSSYVFAGPSASVTVAAGQRLVGAAEAPLATASGVAAVRAGLCYRLGAGALVNFVQNEYSIVEIDATRTPIAAAAATGPLPGGTYDVGFCVQNDSSTPVGDNDWVNGWVLIVH